ncbi:LysR family transcriptional regulator [Vreelandella nanhaiensis]|uniref:LysR family transcriptional regulator n=1 Tax=Vreelandella nanhaiensis TaxID=1258546 RepID=A0A433KVL9_9GAMM|nr:LysR family transcriptional regulator [Halomonas nanhaiensis]
MAVVRLGSVSRTAEQVHLTQPAVSLKLKQLQQKLELILFECRLQWLVLTNDGHVQGFGPSRSFALHGIWPAIRTSYRAPFSRCMLQESSG